MGVSGLPTQVGEEKAGGGRRRQEFPEDGVYEVLTLDTEDRPWTNSQTNESGESHAIIATLMDGDGETHVIKYSYELDDKGLMKPLKGGGRLRTALDSLGFEGSWDIEGQSFRFETKTFKLTGGDRDGTTYGVFLPTAKAEAAAAGAGSAKASTNGATTYSEEGVAAILAILAEADGPQTSGAVFKIAMKNEAVKNDKALYNELASGKAFAHIPGIVKDGTKFALAE